MKHNLRDAVMMLAVLLALFGLSYGPAVAQSKGGVLPDVVGFRPGVAVPEATAQMKAYNKIGRVVAAPMANADFGDKAIPRLLILGDDGENSADIVSMDLTFPPGKQVVWRITRRVVFAEGKHPLITDLLTALREKYGPESYVVASNPPGPSWFFDEQGKRAMDSGGVFADCAYAGAGSLPTVDVHLLAGQLATMQGTPPEPLGNIHEPCKALVAVRALIQPAADPATASSLIVSISDNPLADREYKATVDFLNKVAVGRRQPELEKAGKQARPKL